MSRRRVNQIERELTTKHSAGLTLVLRMERSVDTKVLLEPVTLLPASTTMLITVLLHKVEATTTKELALDMLPLVNHVELLTTMCSVLLVQLVTFSKTFALPILFQIPPDILESNVVLLTSTAVITTLTL
jgi:hypothetical protein